MEQKLLLKRKNGAKSTLREEWHRAADGSGLLLLKYPLLEETGIVKHCFTTRLGGVSEGMFSSLNLGFSAGTDGRRWRRILEGLRRRSLWTWRSLCVLTRHIW